MSIGKKSIRAARNYRDTLLWSKSILAIATLIGAWASPMFQDSLLIPLVLCLTTAWAAICHMVEGFIHRKVLNSSSIGPLFLIAVLFSPIPIPIFVGAFLGVASYLLLIAYVASCPKVDLVAGDRFYMFRHPFSRIIPMAHLAPEPLSAVFEPIVALYWSVGTFNIPIWRISAFDPPALHNYIQSRATKLGRYPRGWHEALSVFRRAHGLLNLLDTLQRFEEVDLDGVALAASARLALSSIPENSRDILNEVLHTLKPVRQKNILNAFDLDPSPA